MTRPATASRRVASSGQGAVEFTLFVPVVLIILLGMLEFGFVFTDHLTLEYATREGVRAGAAMADGSISDSGCGGTQLNSTNVDGLIVAAVQRVLESPGKPVDMSQIQDVRIYQVLNNGTVTGKANVWSYRRGETAPGNTSNPFVPCLTPQQRLDFYPSSTINGGWDASARNNNNSVAPDSIGVSISYSYQLKTPLSGILRFVGGAGATSLLMSDRTVMALEPTQ